MSNATKEIARWSHEEVDALLQAWREGLTHEPAPLRRGKLNAYVSDRFHALRAAHEPFRTACSIVYKKKYWKSMAQFICDYNEQSVDEGTDWFSLGQEDRKRCFNKLKTTSYKFTDLEQDTVFEIAKLLTLEDGTPDKSHLVYLSSASSTAASSSGAGGGERAGGGGGGGLDSRQDTPRAYLPPVANTQPSPVRRNPARERRSAMTYDDDGYGEDGKDSTTSSDGEAYGDAPGFQYPQSTASKPDVYNSHRAIFEADKAHPAPNEYHHQYRQYQHEAQSATPDMMKIVDRLEAQAQELKEMVNQEREARTQAREQHEQHQQEWEREQEEHQRVLEKLRGNQQESVANQQARQSEHDEWATVLQQLQLERQERLRVQAARSKDQEERRTLLEEMKRNQDERQRMRDQWEIEREERAMLLEQISQEREAREQDDKEWRELLQQMTRDLAAKDEKEKRSEKVSQGKQAGSKNANDQPTKAQTGGGQGPEAAKQGGTIQSQADQTRGKHAQIKPTNGAEPKSSVVSVTKVAGPKTASTFKEAVRRLSNGQVSGIDAETIKPPSAPELKSASTAKAVEPKAGSTIKDVNEGAEVLRVLRHSPLPVTGKRSRQAGGGKDTTGATPPQRGGRVNRPRRA